MVAMMCLSFIVVIFIAVAYLLCECYLSPFIVSVWSSRNGANVCLAHSLCHSCVWSTPCSTVLLLHNLFCTNRMWKWIGTFGNLYSKWYKLCYYVPGTLHFVLFSYCWSFPSASSSFSFSSCNCWKYRFSTVFNVSSSARTKNRLNTKHTVVCCAYAII